MTPEQFEKQLRKDLRSIRTQARQAIKRTASKAVQVVKKNAPVAFAELQDSVSASTLVGDIKTIVSAPHAQAVEVGSRPHFVPIELLIKWVKLRGMQGLSKLERLRGSTSREHAVRVASQLKSLENEGSLDINAPEQVARAIQMAILHNGTKPHWFVQRSLPEVMTILDKELKKALVGVSRHNG